MLNLRTIIPAIIIMLHPLLYWTGAQEIALVRGTVSTPNDAERNYADAVTTRLIRWLTELNIQHKVLDDEAVSSETLKGISAVILGYNPRLPQKELAALKTLTDRGGKIIVFYSSDHELAKLLNMKLGNYVSGGDGNRRSLIKFQEGAPPHLPPSVIQESRNIRPAHPVPGKSRVIAIWTDESGKSNFEPAWVQSDNGFWMSHVLMDEGDTENKKQMILAIVAYCVPKTWASVASHQMFNASVLPGYRDFPETVKGIASRAVNSPSESKARAALDEASALYLDLKQILDARQYPEIVAKCRKLSALLTTAYACVQPTAPAQFRGIWEQTGIGLYPGDWNRTCRAVAENGFTDILPFSAFAGMAHYNSKIIPTSNSFRILGDQLAGCIEAAHRNGLRVHAWKGCWRLDYAPEEFINKLKKENRLMISDSGKTANWLCPSNPDNLRLEKDIIREILQNYKVDGIHLDFIRFKDSLTCFCTGCRTRFEDSTGKKVCKWPIPPGKTEIRKEFNQWRCAQITRLVRDTKVLAGRIKPDVKISAAVYANYPGITESIAQDWGLWLKEGLVDFVCPMDYIQNSDRFAATVQRQLGLPAAAGKIYPGIGVTASESRLSPLQTMDQIAITGRNGARGFALFDLNNSTEKEILPLLRLSATAAK